MFRSTASIEVNKMFTAFRINPFSSVNTRPCIRQYPQTNLFFLLPDGAAIDKKTLDAAGSTFHKAQGVSPSCKQFSHSRVNIGAAGSAISHRPKLEEEKMPKNCPDGLCR